MSLNYEKENRMGLTPTLSHLLDTIPDDCILCPEELSEYMGLSVRQIRRYCEQGKMVSYCFGRKYIVYGMDFKNFMRNSQVRPTAIRESLQ